MNEPVRLDVYREVPAVVPLREREHESVCAWCFWSEGVNPMACHHPRHNPSGCRGANFWTNNFNSGACCGVYRASLWTRLLQWLRLRPFIERTRKYDEGT